MLGHCWEIAAHTMHPQTKTPQSLIFAAFALCLLFQSRITKIPCATVTPPGIEGTLTGGIVAKKQKSAKRSPGSQAIGDFVLGGCVSAWLQ
jgi:hypothetical protein